MSLLVFPTAGDDDGGVPPELITLTPEQPGDEAFLFEVYASTRAEELALTNWDEPTRAAFLRMQFAAMRRGYAGAYPGAEFSIIREGTERIGRLVVNRGAEEVRVVDVALLPERRNGGIGTLLMNRVCEEARAAGKPVRLSVLKNNPAVRWYERLGFVKTADTGVYEELEWRGGAAAHGP